jgi:EmrB/QacA subfamily drug resistance transporter
MSPPTVAPRRAGVLTTLCLGVLVAQIDTSVVNLAVRPIGHALGAGVAALQWVMDAYNLAYAVLLLSGGLLGDLYGRRRAFLAGVAVFALGCLVCGFAPGAGVLILGRAIAGVGAALLLPASLAIVRVTWSDPAERGRALGVWAGCNGLAFAIGPTIGGLLIEGFGWRSVFLIVLPPCALAVALALRYVPESADPEGRRLDPGGQIWGALALGGFALAAIEGRERPAVLAGAAALAVVAALLFVRTERRLGGAALLPLDLFRRRAFVGAIAATAAMTFGMYGLLFLVPLCWQQGAQAMSPVRAGLGLLPMALAFVLVSYGSGALLERVGARLATVAGTALIGAGLLTLALSDAGRPLALAQAGLLLAGVGMGVNTAPLMGVAVAAVPPQRAGIASALINVARMAGATLGVAVLGTAYALRGGAGAGLTAAMLAGGLVQLGGAAVAAATIDRHATRAAS